jgi:hypothetical protein
MFILFITLFILSISFPVNKVNNDNSIITKKNVNKVKRKAVRCLGNTTAYKELLQSQDYWCKAFLVILNNCYESYGDKK